jgi:hypothetical protein
MVFISVLLATIPGTLANVAGLTVVAEARSRGRRERQPEAPEKQIA